MNQASAELKAEHSDETTTADQADCILEAGQKRKSEESNELAVEEPKTKQARRQKQRRDDDFRKDDLLSAEYYFENGLRKVKPYYFVYRAYAKGRWMHRPLLQVFTQEFQDRDEKYYRYAIENGLITINDEKKALDYIVKNNDVMGHRIHRHEPAVTDKPIQIVHREDDLLVINKPGGIPVHPAGRYRHNTVVHVLRKMLDVPRLFPANRLDRPTSGLMLIGLNPDKARQFEAQMKEGQIRKEYVCRVAGKFPEGEVVCDAPIKTISYKLSLNYVHKDGKHCKTVFERLSYNGETSVVRCRPLTGRTHQIRVHLRFLGYPIANDPTYSDKAPWADLMGKGQTLDDEAADKIVQKALEVSPHQVGIWEEDAHEKVQQKQQDDQDVEGKCSECGLSLSADPRPEDLFIWLHAWKYSGDGWAFETEMPEWARDDNIEKANIDQDTTSSSQS